VIIDAIQNALTEDNGNFIIITEDSSQLWPEYKQALSQSGQRIAIFLNDSLKLPKGDILISFRDCGTVNAFYNPQDAEIIMCYELFQKFLSFYGNKQNAVKAYFFVFFHELGHALVDQLDLSILGKEEDGVDGMATVIMVNTEMPEAAILAGFFFNNQQDSEHNWFDSHSVGPQRMVNLVCWAIGGQPDLLLENPNLMDLAKQIIILGQRDCKAEYNQQESAVEEFWKPYVKY